MFIVFVIKINIMFIVVVIIINIMVFRPKYCRSARLCLETLFLVELKL